MDSVSSSQFENAAAEHLQQVTTKGAPKTAGKCKAKWGIVCIKHYQV